MVFKNNKVYIGVNKDGILSIKKAWSGEENRLKTKNYCKPENLARVTMFSSCTISMGLLKSGV